MKLSVIIPTYNEEDNIRLLLEKLSSLDYVGEIIVIDDGSEDSTVEIIKEIMNKDKRVILIERYRKLGLGTAYIEGIKKAKFDFIVTMDADLSHDPYELNKFIKEIQDFDLIIGSRRIKGSLIIGWGLYRYIIHLIANALVKSLLGIKINDATSGYRIYKTKSIKNIINLIKSKGFSFQIETLFFLFKFNYKIKEIPIIFVNRKKGKSKLNFKEIILFLYSLIYLISFRFK